MKQALGAAGLVIAPSNFLRERLIEAGAVEPEKIIYSDYGFDRGPFEGLKRKEQGPVRFGFIGTPVEHKGLHVAVEAMNSVEAKDAILEVHGDLTWFPAYARRLKKLARHPGISFKGRFEHGRIGDILAGLDALIVPSLWYENSPLTIHESFMAGVPVITSDVGGMAELVGQGGGVTFKTGDSEDLSRVMNRLANNPDELERLRNSIPPVKTVDQNLDELVEHYEKLVS